MDEKVLKSFKPAAMLGYISKVSQPDAAWRALCNYSRYALERLERTYPAYILTVNNSPTVGGYNDSATNVELLVRMLDLIEILKIEAPSELASVLWFFAAFRYRDIAEACYFLVAVNGPQELRNFNVDVFESKPALSSEIFGSVIAAPTPALLDILTKASLDSLKEFLTNLLQEGTHRRVVLRYYLVAMVELSILGQYTRVVPLLAQVLATLKEFLLIEQLMAGTARNATQELYRQELKQYHSGLYTLDIPNVSAALPLPLPPIIQSKNRAQAKTDMITRVISQLYSQDLNQIGTPAETSEELSDKLAKAFQTNYRKPMPYEFYLQSLPSYFERLERLNPDVELQDRVRELADEFVSHNNYEALAVMADLGYPLGSSHALANLVLSAAIDEMSIAAIVTRHLVEEPSRLQYLAGDQVLVFILRTDNVLLLSRLLTFEGLRSQEFREDLKGRAIALKAPRCLSLLESLLE